MISAIQRSIRQHQLPRLIICLLFLLSINLAENASQAQQPTPQAAGADGDLQAWSRFINGTTVAVFRIDTSRLAVPAIAEAFDNSVVFVALDIPASQSHPILRLYTRTKASDAWETQFQALQLSDPQREGDHFRYSMVLNPSKDSVAPIDDSVLPHDRPPLQAAVAALRQSPLQGVILPPDYVRSTFSDLLPEMPQTLGGGPTSVLTEGLLWAAISVDLEASDAQVEIQSASETAASRLAAHLPVLAQHLSPMLQLPELAQLAEAIKPEVRGDRIFIRLPAAPVTTLAEAIARRATLYVAVAKVRDRLKSIALAIHNFHDVHRHFPPPALGRDAEGKPLLSWRVHLLPFLDEAELYAQFRLDEAWDSPHNRPLVEKIPPIFTSPGVPRGHTTLLAPVGEKTIFGSAEPVGFQHIIDGTSNTAMVVAVTPDRAVPWTAPQDYEFDPAQPSAGLARDEAGRIPAVFADGAYHALPGDLPEQTLLHLFQMNDGNPVRW